MLRADFASPADLALCRQMIRQGSRSFHLASFLLPSRQRECARGLYGFCRMADDLVDGAANPERSVSELALRLDRIYSGSPGDHPADRAFADVVHRHLIPREIPDALIEGFLWDSSSRRYREIGDTVGYAVRVAGTVGVMMSLIMGQRDTAALARAIDLGVAMQLSNIGRDLEEDAGLGRVYLPESWLSELGVRFEDVLDEPLRAAPAATRLVKQAEGLYSQAHAGIGMLPRSCRASINAARLLYREIGISSVARGHQGRAVVRRRRKMQLLFKSVGGAFLLPAPDLSPCLPEGQFLIDAVTRSPEPMRRHRGIAGHVNWVVDMLLAVEARKS